MITGISDDDAISIMIDRRSRWIVEHSRLRSSLVTDREQEREIGQRQEHQPLIQGVDNDEATMVPVDREP